MATITTPQDLISAHIPCTHKIHVSGVHDSHSFAPLLSSSLNELPRTEKSYKAKERFIILHIHDQYTINIRSKEEKQIMSSRIVRESKVYLS